MLRTTAGLDSACYGWGGVLEESQDSLQTCSIPKDPKVLEDRDGKVGAAEV